MGNYLWLLDAGHGGINSKGVYTTAPDKMYIYDDEFAIYEGQINRQITDKLYCLAEKHGIDFALIHADVEDTPLLARSSLVNKLQDRNGNCILLSIHSNAGKGKGFEVWTSPGQTPSDPIAEMLCKKYMEHFPEFPFRSDKMKDGDLDKEAKFWMLVKTSCPAVLVENLFFDNRVEAEFLKSYEGQTKIAQCLLDWILLVEKTKPI